MINVAFRRAMIGRGINPFVADLVCELVKTPGGVASVGPLTVRHVVSANGAPLEGAGKAADPEAILKTDPGALEVIAAAVRGDGADDKLATVLEAVRQRFAIDAGLPWFHRAGCYAFTLADGAAPSVGR